MTEDQTPTTRRRELGAQLRRLRLASGLTTELVARQLGFSVSKISRMETGLRAVSPADLPGILRLYAVPEDESHRLMTLALAGQKRARRAVALQPASQESNFAKIKQSGFVELEWDSIRVREYNSGVIPGLLQTESYMWANMRGTAPEIDDSVIKRAVRLRLERQQKLKTNFVYEVIIDAAVLARVVGGVPAMEEQVSRLLDEVERERVDLRVIPFSSDLHPGLNSQFVILTFPSDGAIPDVVFSEGLFGHAKFDSESEVRRFDEVWRHLRSLTEPPEATRDRLRDGLIALKSDCSAEVGLAE